MATNLLLFLLILFFGKTVTTIVTVTERTSCNFSDFCEIPNDNETGICLPLAWCDDDRLNKPGRLRMLRVCKYTESGEIAEICCSLRKPIAVGSRSQISCGNYFPFIMEAALANNNCGDDPCIIPANDDLRAAKAKPLEFPHMAAVGFGDKPAIKWLCGGTIIHPLYILTAGHCTVTQNGDPSWVRVGDLDLELPSEVNGTRDIRIAKIYRHPQYRYPSFYHDIALLKLETFLNFNNVDSVKPACLHTNEPITIWENKLQAIGWGATEFHGKRSSHLLKVNMSVVNYDECKERYPKFRKLSNGIDSEHQICAGNPFGGDTCQGDSGGPLHFNSIDESIVPPRYVVIGITSFGNGCGGGNTTGVYTKVHPYLEWIEDIIWPICNIRDN